MQRYLDKERNENKKEHIFKYLRGLHLYSDICWNDLVMWDKLSFHFFFQYVEIRESMLSISSDIWWKSDIKVAIQAWH